MKKIIPLLFFILLVGFGCSELKKSDYTLVNTFRDTRLLFQIDYPQNWIVTDYVDYTRSGGCVLYKEKGAISEKYGEDIMELCGEGTELKIANFPTPYPSWSLDYTPPRNYLSISMKIRPNGSVYKDYYENEKNVIQKERKEIDIGNGNKLNIIVYDYKDETGAQDMGLPTAIAYYYGDNYLYEFDLPRWSPSSEQEIEVFKKIVSSFKEIK